jgi:hypothetical protein
MNQKIPENDHRPPMTEDQLEWISRQTSRAVNHAVDQAMRTYSKAAATGFVILLLGLVLCVYVVQNYDAAARRAIVDSGRAISVSSCNRDFDSISKDRNLLQRGRENIQQQYAAKDITETAYRRSIAFYDRELREYRLPDCREALDVVTDNPNAPIFIPRPRYPLDKAG